MEANFLFKKLKGTSTTDRAQNAEKKKVPFGAMGSENFLLGSPLYFFFFLVRVAASGRIKDVV